MKRVKQSSWNVPRGFRSASLWGCAGAAVYVGMVCVTVLLSWWQLTPSERVFADGVSPRVRDIVSDVWVWCLFAGVFGAAAGWVAAAPKVPWSFPWALASVLSAFVPLSILGMVAVGFLESAGVLQPLPPQDKGSDPLPIPNRLHVVLIGAACSSAMLLSWMRARLGHEGGPTNDPAITPH